MRISDWSSDVCSSDLRHLVALDPDHQQLALAVPRRGSQFGGHAEGNVQRNGRGVAVAEVVDHLLRAHRVRSEEHKSELQQLMRISYAVICLKKKTERHLQG